jgi:hypothetical protein
VRWWIPASSGHTQKSMRYIRSVYL